MNTISLSGYLATLCGQKLRHNIERCIALIAKSVLNPTDNISIYRRRYDEAVSNFSHLIDRICFGYSRTKADFDDLRQDVLMNLWESMPRFHGNCSMKSWVYRLTLNVCVSSLRQAYRRVHTVALSELLEIVDYDTEQKERFAELHEAVSRLNPLDKAVMILWLEEESYDNIAEITGLSRANVAIRIHRAKDKIKSLMEK